MKPQPNTRLYFDAPIAYLPCDLKFQKLYLGLLFERLRPLSNAGVPKPDPMTFDLFVSTFHRWNPGLFEHWKGIVKDRYCSNPETTSVHGDTIPLFPRYMLNVALALEESEGLERYGRAALALKSYLHSHGKSVSEELRRVSMEQGGPVFAKPMPPGWEPKIAAAHARTTGNACFGPSNPRVLAAQEQLNKEHERVAGDIYERFVSEMGIKS